MIKRTSVAKPNYGAEPNFTSRGELFLIQAFMCTLLISIKTLSTGVETFISLGDFQNYYTLFGLIAKGADLSGSVSGYEPIFPLVLNIISWMGSIDEIEFFLFMLSLEMLSIALVLTAWRASLIKCFFILLLLDQVLIIQFYRQYLATMALLFFFSPTFNATRKESKNIFFKYLFCGLFHSSCFILFFGLAAAKMIDVKRLRLMMVSAFSASYLFEFLFSFAYLDMALGIPLVEKVYFARVIENREAHDSMRIQALLCIPFLFLINRMSLISRVAFFFLAIGILLQWLPVVGNRLSFIGSSLFVGSILHDIMCNIARWFRYDEKRYHFR